MTDQEYYTYFHAIVSTGIACGLFHPIEWVVNYERSGHHRYEDIPKVTEACDRALREFYELHHLEKPKNDEDVQEWVDKYYYKRKM